eukprot:31416-Pelagococcus_subviridis.AAC.10
MTPDGHEICSTLPSPISRVPPDRTDRTNSKRSDGRVDDVRSLPEPEQTLLLRLRRGRGLLLPEGEPALLRFRRLGLRLLRAEGKPPGRAALLRRRLRLVLRDELLLRFHLFQVVLLRHVGTEAAEGDDAGDARHLGRRARDDGAGRDRGAERESGHRGWAAVRTRVSSRRNRKTRRVAANSRL